jgi:hypothetical protein
LIAVLVLMAAAACQLKTANGSTPVSGPAASTPPAAPVVPTPGAVPVDLPASRLDEAGDVNSMAYANRKGVSGGDVFVQDLYERPFNANTMDKYFPYLDIVDIQGFKDDTWGYATITLAGNDSNGALPGQYAVELDLNKDGRGDWLIRASSVTSTQWSRQGVQAWKDADGDVGGSAILAADNNPQGGDGYETLVFDQGKGTLTDGAFARIKPDDPKTVEIAFKLAMLGSPTSYAMGAWAGTNIDPSLFDYNDHMTHIQAGSPNPGDTLYPIKQVAEIDNTCRLAIGFKPSTVIPGLCEQPVQRVKQSQAPGAPPPPPCRPGITFVNPNCP